MEAVMPDLDAALVTFLTGHAALAPLHKGRVGTKLAAGTEPAVRLTALGGTQPMPWESTPEFQIESWGGDQGAASKLARTVEAAVHDLVGPIVGGHVRSVTVALSLMWSPDETTGRARYLTQVSLIAYPEGS